MLQKLKKRKLAPKLDFSVRQEQHETAFFKKLIAETLGHPDKERDANENSQQLQQSLKAIAKKVIP